MATIKVIPETPEGVLRTVREVEALIEKAQHGENSTIWWATPFSLEGCRVTETSGISKSRKFFWAYSVKSGLPMQLSFDLLSNVSGERFHAFLFTNYFLAYGFHLRNQKENVKLL